LVSIAIGNGLTDPLVQYEYYPDMACDDKYGYSLSLSLSHSSLLDPFFLKKLVMKCVQSIQPVPLLSKLVTLTNLHSLVFLEAFTVTLP
jgi:carboxypeptidase C (cathepsin A)